LAFAPKFCTKDARVNVDEIDGRSQFHQTFFDKQKVGGAQRFAKKIHHSILPTIKSPDCRLKSIEDSPNLDCLPNQCAICHSPLARKLLNLFMRKSRA
jgi:hypothetical protein